MRIISGKNRATKLFGFDVEDEGKRPTLDRVKESIFNTLQFDIDGAYVLDVFAGTGNLGLEANSRGAYVTMIDNDKNSISIIKKNIAKCHAQNDVTLLFDDYANVVKKFARENKKFDIIFVDPPYHLGMGDIAVQNCLQILNDNGIIVYEHSNSVKFEKTPNTNVKTKKIGSVVVEYITKCCE